MHLRHLIKIQKASSAAKNRNRVTGSITVFLSLTLLIIMALLGTMVEVTRGKVCRIHGRRVLKNAVDGLMTEYSRPLYERYHLFFLEDGGKEFRQSIAEYAAGTLDTAYATTGNTDFYDGVLNEVMVEGKRYVGEDGGAALQEQIVAYMKQNIAADIVQKFLDRTGKETKFLENLEEQAEEIENRAEEEKEAAQECQSIFELMRLIDGVDCSGGGVKGQEYFVKMLHHGKRLPERFGISEPVVWEAMKGNVVELQTYIGSLVKSGEKKRQFAKLITEVEKTTKAALKIAQGIKQPLGQWNVKGDVVSVLTSNLEILEQTDELLNGTISAESVLELKKMWKRYNTSGISFDYTGVGEKGGGQNPLDAFSDALSGGLAKLVLEENMKISKKSVKNPDHYRKLHADSGTVQKKNANRLQTFAEEEEVDLKGVSGGELIRSDVMMIEYMKKYFSSVAQKAGEGKKRLEYEWEYLLCGEKSDKENLEETLERLILMRSVINTGAIFASSEMRNTAHAAALAVVGFTGMEPLVRFTQTLFIILWGMVEALVDVAAIMQDRDVPLIKTPKNILVKFTDLFQISNHFINEKAKKWKKASSLSFGYAEYLLLMMKAGGWEKIRYRMMDLMEWGVQENSYPEFQFGICVDSFRVTGSFSFATKLFRLPSIQDAIQRQLNEFQQTVTVDAGYLPP